jgi:hypothetical protein
LITEKPKAVRSTKLLAPPLPGGEGRVSDDDARAAIERQAIGCSAARLFDDAVDQALAPR